MIYYSETTQRYTNAAGEYIYFEGTDPRHPGFPPFPGRPWPRESWENSLSDAEWAEYTGIGRVTSARRALLPPPMPPWAGPGGPSGGGAVA